MSNVHVVEASSSFSDKNIELLHFGVIILIICVNRVDLGVSDHGTAKSMAYSRLNLLFCGVQGFFFTYIWGGYKHMQNNV